MIKRFTMTIFLLLIVASSFGVNFYNFQEYFKVDKYADIDSLYVPNGLVATRIHAVESMECDSLDVGKVVVDTLTVVRIDATDIDAVNESLDSTLTCDSISVRSIAGALNGNATTATNADTAAWSNDGAHADTCDYLGGGDNYLAVYSGLITWPGNTEKRAVVRDLIGNSCVGSWALSGSTPADFTVSLECVSDTMYFYIDAADTSAATGKKFHYLILCPGI